MPRCLCGPRVHSTSLTSRTPSVASFHVTLMAQRCWLCRPAQGLDPMVHNALVVLCWSRLRTLQRVCGLPGLPSVLGPNSLLLGIVTLYVQLLPRLQDLASGHGAPVLDCIQRYRVHSLKLFDTTIRAVYLSKIPTNSSAAQALAVALNAVFDVEWCSPGLDEEAIPCASFMEDYMGAFPAFRDDLRGLCGRIGSLKGLLAHVDEHCPGLQPSTPKPQPAVASSATASHDPGVDKVAMSWHCVSYCAHRVTFLSPCRFWRCSRQWTCSTFHCA
jgi:hypothetical protein